MEAVSKITVEFNHSRYNIYAENSQDLYESIVQVNSRPLSIVHLYAVMCIVAMTHLETAQMIAITDAIA